MVVSATPNARASSELLSTLPWRWASICQKRRMVAAGERLGALLQQGGRGASEDEEAAGDGRAVGKHTERGEEVGSPLDFVEHDEPAEPGEREHRVGETGEVARVLEVEVGGGSAPGGGDLPGDGGLAHLARAEEGDDGGLAEEAADAAFGGGAGEGACHIEISAYHAEISRY